MITQAELKEHFEYAPETGVFTRKRTNKVATSPDKNGYLVLNIKRKKFFQHRAAWLYVHGTWPKNQIDHINGVRHDNRICNLRDTTQRENCQNRKEHREGRLVGSSYYSKQKKWRACIGIGKTVNHIGFFATEEEASKAYFKALENPELFLQQKPKRTVTNVIFDRKHKTFRAAKTINKVRAYLGSFKTEAEALAAVARFVEVNEC